jgi:pimeloyl-ACP methyl ester carboxylesterase
LTVTASLLAPVVAVSAALTLKSDTRPVIVYVKKPRGTLYWGGAGLDGPYIAPQLTAFRAAGIQHVSVGLTNTATRQIGTAGMFIDALRAGLTIRYEDDDEWTITSGMNTASEQFNLIGYSYGSLLAAQTANFYARQGHIVDHLVLIGSPIDRDFLKTLQGRKSIRRVVIVDLKDKGDPIYAGISQWDLTMSAQTLGDQMKRQQGEGHFYYAHVIADSPARWAALAQRLHQEGLR